MFPSLGSMPLLCEYEFWFLLRKEKQVVVAASCRDLIGSFLIRILAELFGYCE
jgi:hypothetical protein